MCGFAMLPRPINYNMLLFRRTAKIPFFDNYQGLYPDFLRVSFIFGLYQGTKLCEMRSFLCK